MRTLLLFGHHWIIDGDDFYLLGLIWTMGFGHVCLFIILGLLCHLFIFRFESYCSPSFKHQLVHLLLSMLVLIMDMLMRLEHLRLCLLLPSFFTIKFTHALLRCDPYHMVPCKLNMHILK
jgi:hypothetical protein